MLTDPKISDWHQRSWSERLSIRAMKTLYEYQLGSIPTIELLWRLEEAIEDAKREKKETDEPHNSQSRI